MKIKDTYEYTIPSFLLSAIFNADESGLEDSEIEALNRFENMIVQYHGSNHTWSYDHSEDDEPYFSKYHDVPGILACDCVDLELIVWED